MSPNDFSFVQDGANLLKRKPPRAVVSWRPRSLTRLPVSYTNWNMHLIPHSYCSSKICIWFKGKPQDSQTHLTMALKFRSLFSRTERSYTAKMEQGSARNLKDDDDDFEDAASELTPLSAVADSFEELSALVKSKGFNHDLDLKTFCDACSHVSVLFGCLGIAFKFAELEYVSKVSDLTEAAASYGTLNTILHIDVLNDTVRTSGSLSRNLRRVRQGLHLIRALFQNFLSSDYYCLKDAASEAYTTTCAMYHTWAVRTAVYAGMYALPTRDQLLIKLNETDESAEREMQRYIDASMPIIEYIDNLYITRNISLDW